MVAPNQIKKEIIMDKFLKRVIWLVIIGPAIYLAIVWNTIPETIAMHFNLKGEVDRYGSKNELIIMTLLLTVVNAAVYLLLPQVYRIDPKRYAAENISRLHRIAFAVSIFIAAVLCLLIYTSVHENIEISGRFITAGAGLLLAVIANYMYTIKPNYFAGFRLPWTLNNNENWRKTHLLGGKLMFAGGLLIAVVSLFTSFFFIYGHFVCNTFFRYTYYLYLFL